tara:strand:- start:729 stop:4481 length:3753 start_codon:yes stop_codon:yes gene_type:complete
MAEYPNEISSGSVQDAQTFWDNVNRDDDEDDKSIIDAPTSRSINETMSSGSVQDSQTFWDNVNTDDTSNQMEDVLSLDTTEDVFDVEKGILPSASNINELLEDENYALVERFMNQRFGGTERKTKQEVVDSYVNHMRNFYIGNSMTTLSELAYLNAAKRDSNSEKLNTAGSAYHMFDNMNFGFSDLSAGQTADAVWDYSRGLLWDPINAVSFGIGKVATIGAMKGSAELLKRAAIMSAKSQLGKNASAPALKRAANIAFSNLKPKVMKRVGAIEAKKKAAKKEFLSSMAADTTLAGVVDAAHQTSYQKTHLQDGFSFGRAAFGVGAQSAFGAGMYKIAFPKSKKIMGKLAGSDAIGFTAKHLSDTANIKARVLKQLGRDQKALNKKQLAALISDPAMQATLLAKLIASNVAQERWAAKVKQGMKVASEDGNSMEFDVAIMDGFLHGGVDILDDGTKVQFQGVRQILEDIQIELPADWKGSGFANLTDWLTETVDALPNPLKREINKLSDNTLKKHIIPYKNTKGFTGPKGSGKVLAAEMKVWGAKGNVLARLSRDMRLAGGVTPIQKMNAMDDDVLDAMPPAVDLKKYFGDGFEGFQKSFIKSLISHPATVGLNIMGWVGASSLNSVADTIRGGLYFGMAGYKKAVGGTQKDIDKYFKLGKGLTYELHTLKLRNLLNYEDTIDEMNAFFAFNPEAQKDLFRYISGGIDDDSIIKSLTIDPGALKKADDVSVVDKIIDKAQTMYGVKAQDVVTKSVEFMYQIDKQMRLSHGMSYKEFISSPDLWRRLEMTGERSWSEINARAVSDTLKSVYAKSYGRVKRGESRDWITYGASVIEEARTVPIVGALVPFGQFFNNTIAHMADYTGMSILHRRYTKKGKETARDQMELLTKFSVGMGLMAIMAINEKKNMEAGVQWHEDVTRDGSVRSRLYDFPLSFHKAIGRLVAAEVFDHDNKVDKLALWTDITTQFGPANLTRSVSEVAKSTFDTIGDFYTDPNMDFKEAFLSGVGGTISMYATGFTRPLDPFNQAVGMMRGESYVERDKNQGVKSLNKSIRYVDQLFEGLGVPLQKLVGAEVPGPKYKPLRTDSPPTPVGRILGYREVPRKSAMERMYADVGEPDWRTKIKSYVAPADARMNRTLAQIIEHHAAPVVNSTAWKTADIKTRKRWRTKILSEAKEYTLDLLKSSFDPEERRLAVIYDLTKRGATSKKDLLSYMQELKIDKPIEELSEKEVELIKIFADQEDDRMDDVINY